MKNISSGRFSCTFVHHFTTHLTATPTAYDVTHSIFFEALMHVLTACVQISGATDAAAAADDDQDSRY